MDFQINIKEEDVIEYMLHKQSQRSIIRIIKIAATVLVLVCIAIFAISPSQFWYTIPAGMYMIFMGYFYAPLIEKQKAKSAFKTDKSLNHPIDVKLTDSEMTTIGKFSNGRKSLKALYKIEETKNLILLSMNKTSSFIIPKRDLSKDQIEHILHLKSSSKD